MNDPSLGNGGTIRWRAARIRLFRGYAPLVVILVAFALITTLTATVAPEKDVVTVRESSSALTGGAGSSAATNAESTSTGAATGTTAAAGTSGTASTGGAA